VLLAFEHGYVPPNLHFKSPTAKSQGLAEGRLKVRACVLWF
jgi:acyl transferase domain-containing protein